MNLGLSHFQSNNQEIVDLLTQYLYAEDSNLGEAAGYAIGLIKAGHLDEQFSELLINASRGNLHDRISRCMMMCLGLTHLMNQEKSLSVFEQIYPEQDPVLRTGAVWTLSLGFANSGNNSVLSKLLEIVARDLSYEVRKQAVLGIVFVLLSQPEKAVQILSLLNQSYSEQVRFAVAIGFGIVGTLTKDKSLHNKVKELWEDKVSLVRQAAGIAFGFIH